MKQIEARLKRKHSVSNTGLTSDSFLHSFLDVVSAILWKRNYCFENLNFTLVAALIISNCSQLDGNMSFMPCMIA